MQINKPDHEFVLKIKLLIENCLDISVRTVGFLLLKKVQHIVWPLS